MRNGACLTHFTLYILHYTLIWLVSSVTFFYNNVIENIFIVSHNSDRAI